MRRTALILAVALAASSLALGVAGCGGGSVQYSRSARQPVLIYSVQQGPGAGKDQVMLAIYGDGTCYRQGGYMAYQKGQLEDGKLEELLTRFKDQGFFKTDMETDSYPRDRIMIALSGTSKVATASTTDGRMKDYVDRLDEFQVPITPTSSWKPESIVVVARALPSPIPGTKVMAWPLDPSILEQAATEGGKGLNGAAASQVWDTIANAVSTLPPDYINGEVPEPVFSAGGRYYTDVHAVPMFPMPGI